MSLQERVFGTETEYAINFYPSGAKRTPDIRIIVQTLQEVIFKDYGLPDSEFQVTGAKFHHDLGHAEWAGPECRNAREAALYDKAADHLLAQAAPRAQQLLARKGYEGQLLIVKNNVDSQENTYGCHENYMMLRNTELLVDDHFLRYLARSLVPFLVTRQIFAGAGRLLSTTAAQSPIFEISQRASFIDTVVSKETTKERPIINLGRETEALAAGNYRRLHLILGDANLSGWATWMKLGTTGILLRMVEDLFVVDIPLLQDPVMALRTISRDPTCTCTVPLRDGHTMSAIDIQQHYYSLADNYLNEFGSSAEEDAVMEEWELALNSLQEDPMKLSHRVDWVLKKRLLDAHLSQAGASWETLAGNSAIIDSLHARDLLYHDLSREGWFNHFLYPDTLFTEAEIQNAWSKPPQYTRARVRGEVIKQARQHRYRVTVERWQEIILDGNKIRLPDPLAFDNSLFDDTFEKDWWVQAANHEDPAIRIRTIKHLTWKKQPEALAILMHKAEHDDDELVRYTAVEALGYRAEKTAKDVLMRRLNDADTLVQWAAQEALDRVVHGIPTPPPIIAPAEADEGESLIQLIS